MLVWPVIAALMLSAAVLLIVAAWFFIPFGRMEKDAEGSYKFKFKDSD